MNNSSSDHFKRLAAEKAAEQIKSGMVIGLGTGSTAIYSLRKISEKIKEGSLNNLVGIPSSSRTKAEAIKLGILLTSLDDHPEIDITIDGADEVDKNLNLIKGGGGALLREKILAQASKKEIIVIDESKLSNYLGEKFPVPVEVIRFAKETETRFLESIGAHVKERVIDSGTSFITDEGNIILDVTFDKITEPEKIATLLDKRAGIVEHGLFIGLAHEVIAAGPGGIKFFKKNTIS